MTPKQILDSFSETLMRDERILNARERALVATLLQHAKSATGENHETQEAVRSVIASAVGETVAQRAFAVLGGSIVERILEGSSPTTEMLERPIEVMGPKGPQPPGANEPQPPGVKAPHKEPHPHHPAKDEPTPPGPQPPGTKPPGPQPPGTPLKTPGIIPPGPQPPGVKVPPGPQPPGAPLKTPVVPPGPQPPGGHDRTTAVAKTSVAVAERPQNLPAQCVVLDEFLAPQELEELMRFTIEHENDFRSSEVVEPDSEGGVVNYEHRRSRVLIDLQKHQSVMLERIKSVLPQVLDQLGMEEFQIADVEAQVTASNEGDFFHFHSDNSNEKVASRHLTFVYFFHREPRQFEGGELRIHDARLDGGNYVSEGSYQTIVPQGNQIVFFPCELLHEITPVRCSSQAFADSRFTLNGWLRQ
jgi:Rps23 Pro-64 3,4-dihydroxylase Tpa1-like proline 4-hydroxylase